MMVTSGAELDVLRERLTADQRAVLNAIWDHYLAHNQWVPRRLLHQRFGKPAALSILEQLGENIICETRDDGKEYYRLTFLGVLLTNPGEESEERLVRYLEYVRDRCKADPTLEWVGSQEVEAALGLTTHRSRLLRQLIRLVIGGVAAADSETRSGPSACRSTWMISFRNQICAAMFGSTSSRTPPRVGLPGTPRSLAGSSGSSVTPTCNVRLRRTGARPRTSTRSEGGRVVFILCGGILEAILFDALARDASPHRGQTVASEANRRDLADLVEAARDLGILGAGLPALGQALRDFPRLIHPGFPTGEKVEVTRDEAEAALIAVRMCLRQIAASRGG